MIKKYRELAFTFRDILLIKVSGDWWKHIECAIWKQNQCIVLKDVFLFPYFLGKLCLLGSALIFSTLLFLLLFKTLSFLPVSLPLTQSPGSCHSNPSSTLGPLEYFKNNMQTAPLLPKLSFWSVIIDLAYLKHIYVFPTTHDSSFFIHSTNIYGAPTMCQYYTRQCPCAAE